MSANTDQVVYVHRDTIYSDSVILIHELCDDRLGSDAIGADCQSGPTDVDYIGKVTNGEQDGAEITVARPGGGDAFHKSAETDIGFVSVHTGGPIGGVGGGRIAIWSHLRSQ